MSQDTGRVSRLIAAISEAIGIIAHGARVLAALCLVMIVFVVMAEVLGFHVPYFHVAADQNVAYLVAACAFALRG